MCAYYAILVKNFVCSRCNVSVGIVRLRTKATEFSFSKCNVVCKYLVVGMMSAGSNVTWKYGGV
jgi:hypothetical protein